MIYLLPMVFLAGVLVFLAGYIFIFGERIVLARRVDQVVGAPAVSIREKELSVPLARRVIRPLLTKMAAVLIQFLPSEKETVLAKKISQAGMQERFQPVEMLVMKYLLAIFLGLGALFATSLLGVGPSQMVVILLASVWAGQGLPDYYLMTRIRHRNMEAESTLPQVMDLLTVSVEAGLGFDGAVHKVIEKMDGVLPRELGRMMQEISMGKPRREALKHLAERFEVKDLHNFASAIILGEQLGISIGNVLRGQADQIRQRRRQQAEEKAMKAPVKILFPLVFLIFPALFTIILGPAALRLYDTFIK